MRHGEMPDGTLVNAVRYGPGPLAYHVRDQERLTRALPLHALVSAQAFRSVAVTMDQFVGAIALPDIERSSPISAPDTSVQGWQWPDNSSLLLMPFAYDGLPGLEAIRTGADSEQVTVTNHPMELVMYGDGVTAPFVATLDGFVSETLKLGINISAPSSTVRALLIAAASTLTGGAGGV
jgi:hypothetical protein